MRTRTVITDLYKFEELTKEIQATVISDNYGFNVDHCDWYDAEYDYFNEYLSNYTKLNFKVCGFDIERGSYVCIDNISSCISELIETKAKVWLNYPALYEEVYEPFFNSFNDTELKNLLMLEKYGWLGWLIGSRGDRNRSNEVDAYGIGEEHPKAFALVEKLEVEWTLFCDNLESYFLSALRSEYEYLTSEECIKESLISNEMEFTIEGEPA